MCTLVILRRPQHAWPLVIGANRDEQLDRPWKAPARHWPEQPNVVAGIDLLGGGTWLGVNDSGVISAMLNRKGTLGPAAGKRSRGVLPLQALAHNHAAAAIQALSGLDGREFRAFNMVVLDRDSGFWLRNDGTEITVTPVSEGISMLTHAEVNDESDPRIHTFLPRFRAAPPPDPSQNDFRAWQALLGTRAEPGVKDREAGLTFRLPSGFGTSSAALIALSRSERPAGQPERRFLFSPGAPDQTDWIQVVDGVPDGKESL